MLLTNIIPRKCPRVLKVLWKCSTTRQCEWGMGEKGKHETIVSKLSDKQIKKDVATIIIIIMNIIEWCMYLGTWHQRVLCST